VLELAGFGVSKVQAQPEAETKSADIQAERSSAKAARKARRKREAQRKRQAVPRGRLFSGNQLVGLLMLIAVFFLAFYPNIGKAIDWADPPSEFGYGPSDDWHEALTWMGNTSNTPDPFLDEDFYFERHERPPRARFDYPESAYGVMAWWDPGNWITYMAHRIPNASPRGQKGAPDAAEFLLAQDEASANEVLDRLGSRYVIMEAANAIVQQVGAGIRGEFHAYATWADQNPRNYYDVYYRPAEGGLTPDLVFFPAYYKSMISRLYWFQAEEWTPSEIDVVKVEARSVPGAAGGSVRINLITDSRTFSTYDSAAEFLAANQDYRIIGTQPYLSPVPLEALEHYELVHLSPSPVVERGSATITDVEIFEYSP
jgi:dolichyl-diphosphooligosaccharide--protein glycosyltransferase